MTEQKFVYVDVDYLKELEETAKKVDYYKGVIDGINLAIDRKAEPQTEENKIPEYAPWRDAFDSMDCCSMEVQDDNGNDID